MKRNVLVHLFRIKDAVVAVLILCQVFLQSLEWRKIFLPSFRAVLPLIFPHWNNSVLVNAFITCGISAEVLSSGGERRLDGNLRDSGESLLSGA